ncbi:MAG: restriction endonuclease subunit S [Alphaproteobacteria bacterium]|nr:restriction endonuclease subunit S [Alphaproteobacteria bacterium]
MPNNLPLNWCECKLETVCALDNGLKQNGLDLPLLDAKYLRGKKEAEYRQEGVVLNPEDYVILVDGENSGEIFSIYETGIMGSTFKKLSFSEFCSIPYTLFFIKSKQDLFRTNKKGAAIPHLDKTLFKNLMLPLPPLAEQERIVEKIEALFAGIDEGVERLKSAQAQIKQYRQSVLKSAFEGKLYKKNDNENEVQKLSSEIEKEAQCLIKSKQIQKAKEIYPFDVNHHPINIPDSWIWRRLYDVAFITKLAGFEYTKYIKLTESGEVPTIRAQNVRKYTLDETNLMYIDLKTSKFLERSALTKPAILITFIGAGIGDVALFDRKKRYHLAPNVAKVELFNSLSYKISEKYILYYLNSPIGQQELFKYMKATAQPSLSMGTIRDIYFPLCSLPEQQRIVEEIEKRFAVADVLEKAVNEGLEKS